MNNGEILEKLLILTNEYENWLCSEYNYYYHIETVIRARKYKNKELMLSLLKSGETSNLIILLELLKNE